MLGIQVARRLNQSVLFENTGCICETGVDERGGSIVSVVCVDVLALASLQFRDDLEAFRNRPFITARLRIPGSVGCEALGLLQVALMLINVSENRFGLRFELLETGFLAEFDALFELTDSFRYVVASKRDLGRQDESIRSG
jgi:hypothetical protein